MNNNINNIQNGFNDNFNSNFNNNCNYSSQTPLWQTEQPKQQLPDLDSETIHNINFFLRLAKSMIIASIVIAIILLILFIAMDNEDLYLFLPFSILAEIGACLLYANSLKNRALLLYQTYKIKEYLETTKQEEVKQEKTESTKKEKKK